MAWWKKLFQVVAFFYSLATLVYIFIAYTNPDLFSLQWIMNLGVISGLVIFLTSLYYLLGFNEPLQE